MVIEDGPAASVKNTAPQCLQLEQGINNLLANAGKCSTAEDCTAGLLDSCEFGCFAAKNKTEDINPLIQAVKQFDSTCSTCKLPCDVPPSEFQCVNSKCAAVFPEETQ